MQLVHLFGQVYHWTKEDVEALTIPEANYLQMLINRDNQKRAMATRR